MSFVLSVSRTGVPRISGIVSKQSFSSKGHDRLSRVGEERQRYTGWDSPEGLTHRTKERDEDSDTDRGTIPSFSSERGLKSLRLGGNFIGVQKIFEDPMTKGPSTRGGPVTTHPTTLHSQSKTLFPPVTDRNGEGPDGEMGIGRWTEILTFIRTLASLCPPVLPNYRTTHEEVLRTTPDHLLNRTDLSETPTTSPCLSSTVEGFESTSPRTGKRDFPGRTPTKRPRSPLTSRRPPRLRRRPTLGRKEWERPHVPPGVT